jgi:NAD+ kinase
LAFGSSKKKILFLGEIVIDKKYSLKNIIKVCLVTLLTCTEDINFAMNEVSVSRKDTTLMITIDTFF